NALADFADVAERHRRQPVDADVNILGGFVAAGNVEVAPARRTRADEDRIPVFRKKRLETVDALAGAKFDAKIEDVSAFLVDNGIGQAEFRDLRADHAAGFGIAVKYDTLVAERCEIPCNGEGGWTTADQCDALAIFVCCPFW